MLKSEEQFYESSGINRFASLVLRRVLGHHLTIIITIIVIIRLQICKLSFAKSFTASFKDYYHNYSIMIIQRHTRSHEICFF